MPSKKSAIATGVLFASFCLTACAGRVQTPTEGLNQVEKGQETPTSPPSEETRTIDGERFDPVTDEAVTTGALKAWRVALRHDKSTLTGDELEKARKEDEAESMKQLEELSQEYPNSSYLKMMMGQVKHHFKKDGEAATFYREAVAKNRRDPMLTFKLAEAKRSEGKLDEAIGFYREAIRLQPDWADPKVMLARALFTKDASSKEARDLVVVVLETTPTHAEALTLQKEMAKPAK